MTDSDSSLGSRAVSAGLEPGEGCARKEPSADDSNEAGGGAWLRDGAGIADIHVFIGQTTPARLEQVRCRPEHLEEASARPQGLRPSD